MQIRVSKSKAIERLSALRDAIEGLRIANAESPGFLKWREDLWGAFKHTFGRGSDEMQSILSIDFGPNWTMSPDENTRTFHQGLDESYAQIASLVEQVELYCADDVASRQNYGSAETDGTTESNQVFVVHGRDQGALAEVKLALIQLGLEPVILQELPDQGRTIIEKFEDYAQVGFAVILCTPDDDGRLAVDDSAPHPRARQNVVFEWGFFIGKLGRHRVRALIKGKVEIPSDYDGVLYVEMDDGGAWKMKLVRELRAAEYAVDANKLV